MKKKNKLLTIATVCYNSEKNIEKCIKSITSQITDEVEYLIIDGCSTDKTLEIIKKYEDKLRYISERDTGIYNAMNKAINNATGEWILFINSDDIMLKNTLPKLINELSSMAAYDCVYADIELSYKTNNCEYLRVHTTTDDLSCLNKTMALHHQSLICKISSLKKVNGFNEDYRIAADWDLVLKMKNCGMSFRKIDYIFSRFYFGGASSKHVLKERHMVRKNNNCYKLIDFSYIMDFIHSLELRRRITSMLYKDEKTMMEKRGFSKKESIGKR